MTDHLLEKIRSARDEAADERNALDQIVRQLTAALDALTGDDPEVTAAKPRDRAASRAAKPKRKSPAKGTYPCEECGRVFSRINGLTRHQGQTHGKRPTARDVARSTPTPEPPLADRIAAMNGGPPTLPPRPLAAVTAPGQTTGAANGGNTSPPSPSPIHDDGTHPHQCDTCGDTFRTNTRLRQHQANAHKTA